MRPRGCRGSSTLLSLIPEVVVTPRGQTAKDLTHALTGRMRLIIERRAGRRKRPSSRCCNGHGQTLGTQTSRANVCISPRPDDVATQETVTLLDFMHVSVLRNAAAQIPTGHASPDYTTDRAPPVEGTRGTTYVQQQTTQHASLSESSPPVCEVLRTCPLSQHRT